MKYYRFLGLEGRITIPLEIREYLDLEDRALLSFTLEENSIVIRREQICNNCSNGNQEDFEELFDRMPIETQQHLLMKLAMRLMKNRKGDAHGRH